jgi:hypothetical protein
MRLSIIHVASVLVMVGTAASAQSFKQVKTEKEFREQIVDRKLLGEVGWMRVKSDGKTEGHILNQKFRAAWVWANKMYCRNAVLGKRDLGTDCQVVKLSGDQVQFIREYGKGDTGQMRIE